MLAVMFLQVSILTRSEGRMRQDDEASCKRRPPGFQSSPDPKAGCDSWLWRDHSTVNRFQSSPDPKARCDAPKALLVIPCPFTFQSSPDPKAGCDL